MAYSRGSGLRKLDDSCFPTKRDFCYCTPVNTAIVLYLCSCFFIIRNCSFFMGIIFCSSVALVWTFGARGAYNFITKKASIPVNLVSFFNGISLLFCCFVKSGVTNELKSLFLLNIKKFRVIYSKQDETLLLLKH